MKANTLATVAGVSALGALTRLLGRARAANNERHAAPPFDPAGVHRILVVRLDEIGDAVMTVPTLRALRRHFERAHITAVVRPAAGQLLEHCPYVDEVHVLRGPLHGPSRIVSRFLRSAALARRELGDRPFDLAIIPRWEVDKYFATMVAYLSGATRIVGYSEHVSDEKSIKNRGFDRLLTHALRGGQGRHEVERALGVAAFVGAPVEDGSLELWTTSADDARAQQFLNEAGVRGTSRLLALAPGAGLERRQWPADRFAELAREMAARHRMRAVILGGPEDAALGAMIARSVGDGAIDLTGRPSLRQVVALLRRCVLFVGNDSGPMHLAAAAGVPIVEVSCHPLGADPEHHNAPERFGPWGTRSEVVRPSTPRLPCKDGCESSEAHCILDVHTSRVVDAAERLVRIEAHERSAQRIGEVKA